MTRSDQAARDLEFVRGGVEAQDDPSQRMPASVGILWTAIILIGCLLNDFYSQWSWLFWATAAPIGSMFCGVLSSRRAVQMGEMNARVGVLNGLHWSCMFWVPIPVIMLFLRGKIDMQTCGTILLLLSGMGYYLAGVHLDRRWILPGITLVAAAGLLVFVHRYAWTIAAAMTSASLLVSFFVIGPKPQAVAIHHG